MIGVSDNLDSLQILSGTRCVGIIWESSHDLKVNLLSAKLLKETLSCLNRLSYIFLESTNLVLESKAETLNGCERLDRVECNQRGVEICGLILGSRVEVDQSVNFVDH